MQARIIAGARRCNFNSRYNFSCFCGTQNLPTSCEQVRGDFSNSVECTASERSSRSYVRQDLSEASRVEVSTIEPSDACACPSRRVAHSQFISLSFLYLPIHPTEKNVRNLTTHGPEFLGIKCGRKCKEESINSQLPSSRASSLSILSTLTCCL